jgi:hypothetical protein
LDMERVGGGAVGISSNLYFVLTLRGGTPFTCFDSVSADSRPEN